MPAIARTLCVFVFALLAACNRNGDAQKRPQMPPVPVQTGAASKKDIPVDLRAIGNVEPIASVAIKAQVTGELISVHFEEGQDVKKGQLLFTIQPRLYDTQLKQAKANLARDTALALSAKQDLERQQELDRKGAGVKEALERARAAAVAADATVAADEALVLIAETQVNYTTIESPIDGRTGAIRARPGNLIRNTSDDALTTVVQLAPIYVTFALPEQHLSDIRLAMAARKLAVTAVDPKSNRALGKGELTFIANTVDSTTGTITLKATFANEDRALWPGAFVDAVLHLDTERGATIVPAAAVSIGQGGPQVYVVKEDATAELRPVKTGRTVGDDTVILEGVRDGEKIVINGQSRLMPGAKVIEKPAASVPPPGKHEAQKSEARFEVETPREPAGA